MKQLQKLYDFRRLSEEIGEPITESMNERIREEELSALLESAIPALREEIASVLSSFECPISLSVSYVPGEPIQVNLTQPLSANQEGTTPSLESHPVSSKEHRKPSPKPKHRGPRKESQGFRVIFPDGEVIHQKMAVATYIHAIRRFGYEAVHALGIKRGGVNIVTQEERLSRPGAIYQHEIEGWFIFTLLSNDAKKELLAAIAKKLSLAIRVEDV